MVEVARAVGRMELPALARLARTSRAWHQIVRGKGAGDLWESLARGQFWQIQQLKEVMGGDWEPYSYRDLYRTYNRLERLLNGPAEARRRERSRFSAMQLLHREYPGSPSLMGEPGPVPLQSYVLTFELLFENQRVGSGSAKLDSFEALSGGYVSLFGRKPPLVDDESRDDDRSERKFVADGDHPIPACFEADFLAGKDWDGFQLQDKLCLRVFAIAPKLSTLGEDIFDRHAPFHRVVLLYDGSN